MTSSSSMSTSASSSSSPESPEFQPRLSSRLLRIESALETLKDIVMGNDTCVHRECAGLEKVLNAIFSKLTNLEEAVRQVQVQVTAVGDQKGKDIIEDTKMETGDTKEDDTRAGLRLPPICIANKHRQKLFQHDRSS